MKYKTLPYGQNRSNLFIDIILDKKQLFCNFVTFKEKILKFASLPSKISRTGRVMQD